MNRGAVRVIALLIKGLLLYIICFVTIIFKHKEDENE